MNKILIIKTSALGDIVHVYPFIDFLHEKYPEAHIDWVVESANAILVNSHPYVNRTLTVSTKKWRKNFWKKETFEEIKTFRQSLRKSHYDIAFDLQGNVKSGLILSQVLAKRKIGFGLKSVPEWPNLLFTNERYNPILLRKDQNNIREDYLSILFQALNVNSKNFVSFSSQIFLELPIQSEERYLLPDRLNVMVCPGSIWPNKQLPLKTLAEFLSLLQKSLQCTFLFTWGSSQEQKMAQELHTLFPDSSEVITKLSLPMLQYLMSRCDLIVAMDSLPLHLCGTVSTPSFSVFGASSALKYKPIGQEHKAFQGGCPFGRVFEKRCPVLRTCPTGDCIHSLSSEELFNCFMEWWRHK